MNDTPIDYTSHYFTEYCNIINNRRLNPLGNDEVGEIHHILPRSCGGLDDDVNLIKLLPAEHLRCHELLPLIFTGEMRNKMAAAWRMMTRGGKYATPEEYEELKSAFREATSKRMKGHIIVRKRPLKKKRHCPPDQKKALSEAAKKRWQDPEFREKMKRRMKGSHTMSEEGKRKISEANSKRKRTWYWRRQKSVEMSLRWRNPESRAKLLEHWHNKNNNKDEN